VGDKWTLLIIRDLAAGPRRFVELQRVLPGISTEQLRSRLNRMVADGLLSRERYREVPPRVEYELTDSSRELLPVIGALARWGSRWSWGEPTAGEAIDIGAILRSLTGIEPPAEFEGVIEVGVATETADFTYAVTAAGSFSIKERPALSPDATIRGPQTAWIRAFSPESDSSGLKIYGNAELAAEFLSVIVPVSVQHASIA
jgi:DNA-binding HxlR family transcriptional regulator